MAAVQKVARNACSDLPSAVREEVESLLEIDRKLADRSAVFLEDELADSSESSKRPLMDDPLIGTVVGAFQIERPLGDGVFGVVYLARRTDQSEQCVAHKVIHSHHKHNQAILQRFELERQLLADLSHSNIAKLLDGALRKKVDPTSRWNTLMDCQLLDIAKRMN